MPPHAPTPLLPGGPLAALREALAGFTADAVTGLLGPVGTAAQQRGDLLGTERALDAAAGDPPLATLVRLFLLAEAVPAEQARAALAPLSLEQATPLLRTAGGDTVRATAELRPYAADGRDFWVISDFGSDVRHGPLAADHVLGIGAASLTLVQATIRQRVERALDLGTGCGIQALHLAGHAAQVVATDISPRALRFAATTAALNDMTWDLREGSLLEPVAAERFDLVVANPPFVVSPGLTADAAGGHSYRDSGLAGDGVTENLLRGLPGVLTDSGSAQLLANWIVPADGDWAGRLAGWLAGGGCDAWVWQREVADPGEYVALWLRDAGEAPGTASWRAQYTRWLDWFGAAEVAAVGMGLVALWHSDRPRGQEILHFEDVPQQVSGPAGALLPGWIARQRWLAAADDAALLSARLRAADDTRLVTVSVRSADAGGPRWQPAEFVLRQASGMRWEVEADEAITTLVGACDGSVPLGVLLGLLAATLDTEEAAVTQAALPVVRDLVARGFLDREAG